MFKFFRRIRQKLMNKGNTRKYLKYALGEIFLVVIGILMALQINNWNENRKERAVEINYLKNIKKDLIKELKNTNYFSTIRYDKIKASSFLLNTTEPKTISEAITYINNYETVFMWYAYVPNNNTFKELLSSGKLSLISNEGIKNQLIELDKIYADITIYENHMRREFEEYLYDTQIKNTSGLDLMDTSKLDFITLEKITVTSLSDAKQNKIIKDVQWLFNNQVFANGLKLAYLNNSGILKTHKNLEQFVNDLIVLIDVEIQKEY